jgi:hypothetical protein
MKEINQFREIGNPVDSDAKDAWETSQNLVSESVNYESQISEDIPEIFDKTGDQFSWKEEIVYPSSSTLESVATNSLGMGKFLGRNNPGDGVEIGKPISDIPDMIDIFNSTITNVTEFVSTLSNAMEVPDKLMENLPNITPESNDNNNDKPEQDNPEKSGFDNQRSTEDDGVTDSGHSSPKPDTIYGNFESLKNQLDLEHMPTVSQDSYTMSEDTNGDGQIDYVYDRDNRSIPYHIAEDTNGDGKVDSIYNRYDTDGDGYYETVVEAFDDNKDGKFDYAYKSYDTNGDGHHDTVDYAYGNNSDSGYSDTDQTMLSNDSNNVNYDSDDYMVNNDDGFYNA